MSIYIHYYPKVSTDLLKLIYYNSQMKPHESEGTDHASSQRLKRDLRDREVTTVGRDGAQGIFYKVLRDSKSGRMSRDRGADPRASTGCQKHPKRSLTCKVKTFTIYTVVPFTSQEQT